MNLCFLSWTLGQNATVSLVIPLKERLNLPSLSLSLVDGSGRVLQDATLDTTSLVATFLPIPLPFKFQLSGSTAAGRPFQRISRSFIKAKNVLLRLQRGIGYKTLECGSTLRMSFVLYYNGAQGESFDITVNSSLVVKNRHQLYETRHTNSWPKNSSKLNEEKERFLYCEIENSTKCFGHSQRVGHHSSDCEEGSSLERCRRDVIHRAF